jgi:hypothetical protein
LAADGKRYVFPNESTYFSWYSDFSGVVTIPQSELESYPLGANVTVRPGTKLVKITTNPKVYAVTAGGTLVGIPDETTASTLFGSTWNKRVIDVSDAFFTNYKTSSNVVSATAYPQGSLVKFGGTADVFYINADGTASKIANESVFTANRFQFADVITATIAKPASGADITGAQAILTDTSSGAGGIITIGAGTGLTVALASDTPVSATVITNTTATTGNGQAAIPFVKINFTAASDGDVKVTNLTFKRSGISADSDLDNLYLYNGTTRLTDGSSISSNLVTFNNVQGLFTVPKGTTVSITLVGDMNYAATSGKTIGFSLVGAGNVITNGATVSGSFPMTGNLMSTANATDLGALTLTGYQNYPAKANTSINPSTNTEVFRFTLNGSNQDLNVTRLRLTAVGSIKSTDLQNLKITIAGVQYGPTLTSLDANGVADFDLSANPIIITKGSTKNVSLRADIVSGSTSTFYFSFQNQQDIVVKDMSYGVFVEPYAAGTFSIIRPGTDATPVGNYEIAAGDLSISRSTDSPTSDVSVDATNVTLASFDFTASGEDAKVQNLNVTASTTATATSPTNAYLAGIANGKVYVNGSQVGSTKNLTEAAGSPNTINFTFGSTFIVPAGTTAKVTIVGDVKHSSGTSFSGGETVKVSIGATTSNIQTMTSLNSLSRPTSAVAGNTLTITLAALTVGKYSGFGNQTIVSGTAGARLGSFTVTAGAAEGVSVNSITVTLSSDNAASITNLMLKDNATGAQIGSTQVSPNTSNVFSVNFNLAASQTKVIDIYADLKSSINNGTWFAYVQTDGSGLVTGKSATGGDTSSLIYRTQSMSIGTGSLTATNGSQPTADIILAGTTGNYVGQFTFNATSDNYTVDKMVIKVGNGFSTSTSGVTIKYMDKNGVQQTASNVFTTDAALQGTATFTGLTLWVPSNTSANVDVYVDLTDISSGATSGSNSPVYLSYSTFHATGDSGAVKTSVGTADLNGNTFYVRKSRPTFATQTLSGAPSSGNPLFKFTVVADAKGSIDIKQLGFSIATTTATLKTLKLYDVNGAEVYTTGGTTPGPDVNGNFKLIISNSNNSGGIDDTVLTIGTSPVTYQVKGTLAGWTTGASLTIGFNQDAAAVANNTANALLSAQQLVWSDKSATAHTTATADWTNGFLIKGMSNSQAF